MVITLINYVSSTINEYENFVKNSQDNEYYYINKNCLKLLKAYCDKRKSNMTVDNLNSEFFKIFMLTVAPAIIYQQNDEIIDNILGSLIGFCNFCDMKYETNSGESLKNVSKYILTDFHRVLHLKKEILKYIKSPVLGIYPPVIDLNCYRNKKEVHKSDKNEVIFEEGYFQTADVFSNNSVVLKKMSDYNFYIRLYFNKQVISFIKSKDIMYLKLRRKNFIAGWEVDEIRGCYLPDAINCEEIRQLHNKEVNY